MRLLVIGSTGRTGRHLLDQALERGHEVTAFTRKPATLTDRAGLTAVIGGDAYPIVATQPRIPIAILKTILRAAYTDHRAMEQIVTHAELDYTIARLNRLTDVDRQHLYRIKYQQADPASLDER